MFSCKHCCDNIKSLDEVPNHPCFIGKLVYLEKNNILYATEKDDVSAIEKKPSTSSLIEEDVLTFNSSMKKQQAVWTRSAVLALLAFYEAKLYILDNPRTRGKIWHEIANDLLESYGIQMDDIFGKKKDASNENYTVSSKVCYTIDKAFSQSGKRQTSTSQSGKKRTFHSSCTSSSSQYVEKESYDESSSKSPKLSDACSSVNNTHSKQKSIFRGTGSTIAKTKIELEKQWLHHLTTKQERDRIKDDKYATLIESKKEQIKLKKKQLALKEQELQQRREIAEKKLKEKKIVYDEILEIEKQKYKIFKKYLDNKENQNTHNEFSESD